MQTLGLLPRRRPTAGLAVTARAVVAVASGKDGSRSETSELPADLVTPSVTSPNIGSLAEVAAIAGGLLEAVGAPHGDLAVALPDLSLSTLVYPPRAGSTRKVRRADFRGGLPYRASEARCDFWTGRRGEVLAAAVRDAVVQQYEQVVEATERRLAWVDGASLASIPTWSVEAAKRDGLVVAVQLYRDHYCMSVFKDGALVDLRTKLRAPGTSEHVVSEIRRAPALHDSAVVSLLGISGDGAPDVAAALEDVEAVREIRVDTTDEASLLEASIATLIARGSP